MSNFPREETLADQVAQIAAQLRRLTRARSLGNSSLSPGQGYFEVRDANGAPVARIGEAGIWMPDGVGGWASQDYINQLNRSFRNDIGPRVTSVESRATSLESWRTTASGTLTNHGNRLTTVEGTTSNHGTRITSLETTTSSLSQRQGTAEQQIISLTQRVSNLESAVYGT